MTSTAQTEPARHAILTAWPHLTPDEKSDLTAWAYRLCDIDCADTDALAEIAAAILDCMLEETPEYKKTLIARLDEARRQPGTEIEPGKELENLQGIQDEVSE